MRMLSREQIEHYAAEGFVCPVRALTAEEAGAFLERKDALEAREGPELWQRTKMKPHLLMKWANDLIRHPRILDAVEDLIGPNILAWAVGHFDKKPHDPSFVSWHQDGTYWGFSDPARVVAAWVALTPSRRENGCLRVIPGSHRAGQLPHRDTYAANNMLSRGQDIAVAVDEAQAVDLALEPGEISLHTSLLVHGSEPNRSGLRRTGIVLRYIAADIRPVAGFRDSASLVRGVDVHGHFTPEPWPATDFDPVAVAFYEDVAAETRRRKQALADGYASTM
jgi:ectoine hydroxylase-related dioxygenase (phytanoyl-CoA dioxygenase family)